MRGHERRRALRAALACHTGMATFAEAGVSDKPPMAAEERDDGA